MSASDRLTISVRFRERQLVETIAALEAVNLAAHDAAGQSAILSILEKCRAALKDLQERVR